MPVSFNKPRKIICLALGLILFLALPLAYAQGKPSTQRVVQVKDGDSLVVVNNRGIKTDIRLYGVDAPEYLQPGGEQAKEFASSNALFKEVEITPIDKDKYGRTVALVILPSGKNLNAELIRSGNAWYYGYFCKETFCEEWEEIAQTAKAEKKGLWQQQNPTEPWKWRKRHKQRKRHRW